MLKGFRDAGIDLTQADLVIGTSGGSVAATQMRSGGLDEFYDGLLAPPTIDAPFEGVDMDYFQATSRMWQGGEATPAPGESTKKVAIVIKGDTNAEPDETLFVNLSNPRNAIIFKAQGVGTIVNDDA